MELFHYHVDSELFLQLLKHYPSPPSKQKSILCTNRAFTALAQCSTAESNFSMPDKILLESGRRADARSLYEMPAQWQKVKAWYQEIQQKCFQTNFLKALCYLGRHKFTPLGKPRTDLYDSFPVQGNFFNALPHKKYSSRVSFLCVYPILEYLAEVKINDHAPPSPSQNNKLTNSQVQKLLMS